MEISSEHPYSQTVRIREPNQIFIDFDPTISKQKAAYDARSTFNFFLPTVLLLSPVVYAVLL